MPEFSATEQVNPDFNTAFNQAALQGVERQKAVGGINALSGVDLNDPQSVSNAVGNSIKSGNLDQASALMGVNLTSNIFKTIVPAVQARLAAANAQPSQTQPQSQPQQATPDYQHQADTMSMAKQAVDNLLQLPEDQRPAAAAAMSDQFEKRGVPSAAFDSATQDLSDAALKEKSAFYDAHNQHFTGLASGQAPDESQLPAHSSVGWAAKLVGDPLLNDPFVQATLKRAGFDIEPQLQRAAQLAMPEITKQAEEVHAGPIAAAQAAATIGPEAVKELNKRNIENATKVQDIYINGSPNPTSVTAKDALALAGQGVHFSLEPPPEAKAAATSRGEFLGSLHDFVGKDENGNPVHRQMTGEDYFAARAAGVPTSTIGEAPSDVDVDWKKAGQASLRKVVDSAADNMKNYPKDDFANHQLLSLANTVGTGAYTKTLGDVAQHIAPILGNGAAKDYATNVPLLAQSLSNYTRSQFSGALPRIRSEFDTVTSGLPKNTSPQDQIKIDALLNIAKRNYDNEANKFYTSNADNAKNRTTEGMQMAFDQNQGGRSILSYAMPDLQKTTINGKPAVSNVVEYQGHHWAQFLPGSSHPIKFMID